MSEGLRAEDVRAALAVLTLPHGFVGHGEVELRELTRHTADAFAPAVAVLAAAARDHLQCLASQEQTPDYEAAAKQQCAHWPGSDCWKGHIDGAKAIVDAALVGFHPQPAEELDPFALCLGCESRPPRVLPDPIPEGHPVMFTEMMAGRGLYCDECFDNQDDLQTPEVPT